MNDDRPSGRALAVDLGTRRIGLAMSDRGGTFAFPYDTIVQGADEAEAIGSIVRAVIENEASTVVVGLPLSLDGSEGPAASLTRQWARGLAEALGDVDMVLFDERLTTVAAQAAMTATGRRSHQTRSRIDAAAAAVLLQSWLDAGCPR